MGTVWTIEEGAWALSCALEGAKAPAAFHWQDTYVAFEARCVGDRLTYRVNLRRAKDHDVLADDKWLLLVVGRQKKQREHLEGVKVYRDSKVIFAKMGQIPTFYFLMTRERHGQVG